MFFDALGRRVKILSNNKPLGTTGIFTWDGIDETGMPGPNRDISHIIGNASSFGKGEAVPKYMRFRRSDKGMK
ncbi:MAG: hypothetical protein HC905_18725 [Bacteroidales bacterium]|nr:hypothetical protein [Bacteroidales bacterium]